MPGYAKIWGGGDWGALGGLQIAWQTSPWLKKGKVFSTIIELLFIALLLLALSFSPYVVLRIFKTQSICA